MKNPSLYLIQNFILKDSYTFIYHRRSEFNVLMIVSNKYTYENENRKNNILIVFLRNYYLYSAFTKLEKTISSNKSLFIKILV